VRLLNLLLAAFLGLAVCDGWKRNQIEKEQNWGWVISMRDDERKKEEKKK
jgi:hypothetical protein